MARKSYTEQFKRDAVRLMTDGGYSLAKASASLGVSQATLSAWRKNLAPVGQADRAAAHIARVQS